VTSRRDELTAVVAAEIPLFVSATVLLQVAVADQLGLQVADLHCLNLVGAGTATTPTQIAERMGMTTGAVTKMLDRMERQRLVRREPNPTDRRRTMIRALDDRAEEIAALYAPMSGYLAEQMRQCTDDELSFLANFVRASREVASRETFRLRREGKPHATRRPRETHITRGPAPAAG
jgi:DNA-binding MarR family transcriptional regulator